MPHTNKKESLIRVSGELRKKENRYYLKIADRYRACGFILILVLVLYCGVMLLRYNEYITYDNLLYLVRDLDNVIRNDSDVYEKINYDAQETMVFDTFRGGLAVVGNTSVSLYDSTGGQLCSEKESFSVPAVSKSDKYLLAYGIGGRTYSIYNSLTRVISRETDGDILCASMSDSGAFTVTMESKDAKYVTVVYNSALRKTMSIYTDKYVVDAAISKGGDRIAVVSLSESADSGYEISFYAAGQTETIKTVSYDAAMPFEICSMKEDNFAVLSDNAVSFYSSGGDILNTNSLGGASPSYFSSSGSSIILVCKENALGTQNRVYSFDNEGNILYNTVVPLKITGAAASFDLDGGISGYVKSKDGITALHNDGEDTFVKVEADVLKMIDTENGLLACMDSSADYPFNSSSGS